MLGMGCCSSHMSGVTGIGEGRLTISGMVALVNSDILHIAARSVAFIQEGS